MLKLDKIAKLLGMGAFGATGGFGAVFLGVIWLTTPTRTGGMDKIGAAVTWIAVGGVLLALIALHIYLGKQLILLGQGLDKKHPL